MGLLTSPTAGGSSKKFASMLLTWEPLLSPLLYLGGIVWFLALAYHPYNAATYFSENALLPGLVTNEFSDGGEMFQTLKSLQAEMEGRDSVPHAWIRAQFRQMGLEVYSHNFTLDYPLGHGSVFHGENTYAVLRAARSGSTESLVLSTPCRPPTGPHAPNQAGLALMLALAKYFRRQVYWAKDIIFLVTEHEQLGAAAWLAAYYQVAPGHGLIRAGDLPARAGSIQAAVNLEVESTTISHVDVVVEGLNGQLPNLDLVKMAHWILHQEYVQHTTQNRLDHQRPASEDGYRHSVQTLLSMVVSQAAGTPTGNHGHFNQYGIQAVTLRAVDDPSMPGYRTGLPHLSRVLEGVFRSLNNLLERFHQSFFFYLLPATGRYISIGLYMPPFAMIAVGIVLKALTCWLRFSGSTDDSRVVSSGSPGVSSTPGISGTRDVSGSPGVSDSPGAAGSSAGAAPEKTVTPKPMGQDWRAAGVSGLITTLVLTHAAGAVTLSSLAPVTRLLANVGVPTEEAVFACLAAVAAATLLSPLVVRRRLTPAGQQLSRCLALVELGLFVFTSALFNISAALIVTTIYTPVALSAKRYRSVVGRLGATVCLLLVHPFTLQLAAVTLGALAQTDGVLDTGLLFRVLEADRRALTFALVDSFIYGARLLDVSCTVLLPVWLQLWSLVHCAQV